MDYLKAVDEFVSLQLAVTKNVSETCRSMKRTWVSFSSVINFLQLTTTVYALLIGTLLFPAARESATEQSLAFVVVIVWVAVAVLPFTLLANKLSLFFKPLVVLAQFLVLVGLTVGTERVLNHMSGVASDSSAASQYLSLLLTFGGLTVEVLALAAFIVGWTPHSVILAIATRIPSESLERVVNDDFITSEAVKSTHVRTSTWTKADTKQINTLTKSKMEDLKARVQAVSPSISVLGLLSLVGVILSQDQIQSAVQFLRNSLRLSTASGGGSTAIVVVFLVIATAMVALVTTFFIRMHWSLYILHICSVSCDLRSEELSQQERQQGAPFNGVVSNQGFWTTLKTLFLRR